MYRPDFGLMREEHAVGLLCLDTQLIVIIAGL